ncbi:MULTISPECIES: hypothetical protein [Treponema]|uniref:Membrane protein n=1 Tax=Treponema socranskii subsp. socranskii VPI DR56BR1116 = ATCC 35536 TaxID=1125725 RepID=U2L6X7_TRESO|nr:MULTISPECIES: hypothetical protein [Treponema]ERF60646.1 putative membrane protein [Treponema socranskii subsp. socranskii VPI DR56BR1116 = ATCC 35536]ERK00086.1 putative membrane protein [Treponema socranskii subsp. socranskii VPI DR56BR1116 = ATCC 35536]MBC6719006.1 hypothetical protein [Treponema sp. Marseille-Q4130]
MNDEEIEEQLSLIGALAEDAEAGFESMLVPFSVYGIAIPVGTGATYGCLFFGSAKYVWLIWLFVIGFCQLFLPLYFRRQRQEKIQRASDRIFAALWGSIGFVIVLNFVLSFFGKLDFSAVFFIIGILIAVGCVTSGTLIQRRARIIMYAEGVLWLLSALPCLFVGPHTAPLIISAATFVLLAIPALAALIIMRKKKSSDDRC